MTYNADPRPKYSRKYRQAFLLEEGCTCYWCGLPILPGEPWDIEHRTARELLPAGGDADARENLGAIHRRRCHPAKTKQDRQLIKVSNRTRRKLGPEAEPRQSKHPLLGRGFQPGFRPLRGRNNFQGRNR